MYSSSRHDCQTCLLLPGCELLTVNCKKWIWSAFLNLRRLCLRRYDSFDQEDLYRADVEFLNCLKNIPESSRKNLAGTYRNVYMLGKCWKPLDLSSHSFIPHEATAIHECFALFDILLGDMEVMIHFIQG